MLFCKIIHCIKVYQHCPTSKMNADCPICMDVLDMTKNYVTTECGHCFHASCLMANVAHNGFDCPYCRTVMAEEPENSEDESDGESWSETTDEDENEIYDDYALRGLRFMTNNLEGVDHDILDVHDENEELREQEEEENDTPSAAFITEKLISQGVTMEQLVKCLMLNHDEYADHRNQYNALEQIDNDVFGKMRIIISNYRPEDDQPATPVPRPAEPISTPLMPPTAEAKTPTSTNVMSMQSIPAF